jgi:predicted membrane protein
MSLRTYFGLVLVAVGGGFLLDQLDLIDFGEIFSTWWPLIIILVGLLQLATRSVPVLAGGVVVLVGVLFQVGQLDIFDLDFGALVVPTLIILVGVYLIATRFTRSSTRVHSEDSLNGFVIFGGLERRVDSKVFTGGSITALFGGAEIDMRDAQLASEGGELEVSVAFGGAEIVVPADWNVKLDGLPLFGALTDKTQKSGEGPEFHIKSIVAFGGIEVHN